MPCPALKTSKHTGEKIPGILPGESSPQWTAQLGLLRVCSQRAFNPLGCELSFPHRRESTVASCILAISYRSKEALSL